MPDIREITDLSAPELDIYARLSEGQLLHYYEPDTGLFIAESPKVISRALDAGYEPVSLLMEPEHVEGEAREVVSRCGGIPVYTAEARILTELTGFQLTRGVLCAMRRRQAAGCGFPLRRGQTGGGPGKRHESHQCGGHFPVCGRPGHGRGAPDAGMQRSPVPAGRTGQHGHSVPGALDLF